MFSQFFINRPKFAFVISILITLVGLISLYILPVAQFPEITPPQVTVTAHYPGADVETLEKTVIRPIEEQVNGVENMVYIDSTASNDGAVSITITFKSGTDDDMALVNVQNRVAVAESSLPEEVRRLGIVTKKQSSNMLIGVTLTSTNPKMDGVFLSNYASNYLVEPLSRINGVAKADVLGAQTYSMRIWLNPVRMSALDITTSDVAKALSEQNIVVAAGKLGQGPTLPNQQFQYTIKSQERLSDPAQFKKVIIRAKPDGAIVRLSDIAKVEMGSENYGGEARLDNKASAFLVVYQQPDGNAMSIAKAVKAKMKALSASFPQGLSYQTPFDSTLFIRESIKEVVLTLGQAVLLVIIVVFLFLQNWRATLIPAIAIPVSLIGTFAVLKILGFSINTITLFGLVLAIGVVVDDAIVIVENVERHITQDGLEAKEATQKAMKEVTGPVIATTLVLLAVFVPVAFMPGITGGLYSQFAITISTAVLISSINALTLSPALCATFLKKDKMGQIKWLQPINTGITKLTGGYKSCIALLIRRSVLGVGLLLIIMASAGFLFSKTPTGFVPNEDQGFFILDVQLPDAASINRTNDVLKNIVSKVEKEAGVAHVISVSGFSIIGGNNSNSGMVIVALKDWAYRQSKQLHQMAILQKVQRQFMSFPDAQVRAFAFPPIPGLGSSGGFDFRLQDTEGNSPQQLAQVVQSLLIRANQRPELAGVYSTWRANIPQYLLQVDRNKAKTLGIPLTEIFQTLQTQLGSMYVNDFNKYGKIYHVNLMAESKYRAKPEDLKQYYVRNAQGQKVPISEVVSLKPILGPSSLNHFNLYRSVTINGQAAPGYSSGDAIKTMEELASSLPKAYTFSWAGQSLQEIQAGNLAPILFALAFIFVYLFLVAQYESWVMPLAILGSVPIAIFGAIGGINLGRYFYPSLSNDIYAQIGMVLLLGIAAKTAILIVEFAMQQRSQGKSIAESASNAAVLRFRAVLMTAFSFILGVLPLVVASGAGAASRRIIGTTVMSGMLAATIFGTLLVPIFYYLLQKMRERFKGIKQ